MGRQMGKGYFVGTITVQEKEGFTGEDGKGILAEGARDMRKRRWKR